MQVSKLTTAIGFAFLVASIAVGMMLDLHGSFHNVFSEDASICMIEDAHKNNDNQQKNGTSMGSLSPLDLFTSLEHRCTAMNKEYDNLQKIIIKGSSANDLATVAEAFNSLMSFEAHYAGASEVLDKANINTSSLLATSEPGAAKTLEERRVKWAVETSIEKRSAVRLCFLQVVTAARRLAASLPREAGNSNGALGCERGLLSHLEVRVLEEIEAEEESAKTLAYIGAYWSEVAVNSFSATPLFGAAPMKSGKMGGSRQAWVRDTWGTIAPADLVLAEDYLSNSASAQIPGLTNPALSILHARRLEEHAKFLAGQDQYDASSQRYRAMAKLAEEVGDAALSAHALSQLSHTLKLHGSHEEAISAAKDAVELTMDPLAQFVLASARLSSGLLTTDTSMRAAELQLRTVAGQLPTQELEVQRAKMHSEIMMWRWMSSKDISKCKVVGDAARFLICTLAKLIF